MIGITIDRGPNGPPTSTPIETAGVAYTPGTIANGARVTTTIALAQAYDVGAFVLANFSGDLKGAVVSASIAGSTVTVTTFNGTGLSITIAAGTLSVAAFRLPLESRS